MHVIVTIQRDFQEMHANEFAPTSHSYPYWVVQSAIHSLYHPVPSSLLISNVQSVDDLR